MEPLQTEVEWVMHKADGHAQGYLVRGTHTCVDAEEDDGISRQELLYAISLWYTYQDMVSSRKHCHPLDHFPPLPPSLPSPPSPLFLSLLAPLFSLKRPGHGFYEPQNP
jgi:hypothetical protein